MRDEHGDDDDDDDEDRPTHEARTAVKKFRKLSPHENLARTFREARNVWRTRVAPATLLPSWGNEATIFPGRNYT